MGGGTARKGFVAAALLVVAALIGASLLAGTPAKLPSVALGASWLLHVERVVAGAIAVSVILSIAVRSSYGQLPLKLGATSIEFESLKEAATESLDNLEIEIESLKERIDRIDPGH